MLLDLNLQKEKLEIELSRMPSNSSGRTIAQRKRRKEIETIMDGVLKGMSKVKRELRQLKAL